MGALDLELGLAEKYLIKYLCHRKYDNRKAQGNDLKDINKMRGELWKVKRAEDYTICLKYFSAKTRCNDKMNVK